MNNKKLITLLLTWFLCLPLLFGQSADYRYLSVNADKLIKQYSSNNLSLNRNQLDMKIDFQIAKSLSMEEKYKLIEQVNMVFNQEKYYDLYLLSEYILAQYKYFFVEEDLRKSIVEILLKNCFYYNFSKVDFDSDAKYLTAISVERLKVIMKNQRSLKEKQILEHYYRTIYTKNHVQAEYRKKAKEIMQKTNRKRNKYLKQITDSLTNSEIQQQIGITLSEPPIAANTLYAIGNLENVTFVPIIENLMKKYPEYYKIAGTYSLAKLGEQKYIDEILKDFKTINYRYLETSEAFLRYLELNLIWNETARFRTDSPYYFPKALVIMFFSQSYIKNIPKELKISFVDIEEYKTFKTSNLGCNYNPYTDKNNQKTNEKVMNLYQWMSENKDNLIIVKE